MIGYYVHHHGRGHLHRALACARALGVPVTGLSSLPRPDGWDGPWVVLERDDTGEEPRSPTAHGRLHWVPAGDAGLRRRMAALSGWLRDTGPEAVVVDVSMEVALLVRLHGVPVVCVAQPGMRDDPPHQLGLGVADALIGCWPASAGTMLQGLAADTATRLHTVGAISRFSDRPVPQRRAAGRRTRRVTLLAGTGGDQVDDALLDAARRQTPEWEWTLLGHTGGTWVSDPWPALLDTDVVITHAGQGALADTAAARRPALVIPQERPHAEQRTTAAALRRGRWPVAVEDAFPTDGWAQRLDAVATLDGGQWGAWCDGEAAGRFAEVVGDVARGRLR